MSQFFKSIQYFLKFCNKLASFILQSTLSILLYYFIFVLFLFCIFYYFILFYFCFILFFTPQTHRLCSICHSRVAAGLCWVKRKNHLVFWCLPGRELTFLGHESSALTTRPQPLAILYFLSSVINKPTA